MSESRPLLQYRYHTVYCTEDGRFGCDCDDYTATGRPCPHVLAVMLQEDNGPVAEYIETETVSTGKASIVKKAQKASQKKAKESARATATTSHGDTNTSGSNLEIDSDPEDAAEELEEATSFPLPATHGHPMSDKKVEAEVTAIMALLEEDGNPTDEFALYPTVEVVEKRDAAADLYVSDEEGDNEGEPQTEQFSQLPTVGEEVEDVAPAVVSSQLSSTPGARTSAGRPANITPLHPGRSKKTIDKAQFSARPGVARRPHNSLIPTIKDAEGQEFVRRGIERWKSSDIGSTLDKVERNELKTPVRLADQEEKGLSEEETRLIRGDFSGWLAPDYMMREDDIDYHIRDIVSALSSRLLLRTIVMPHNNLNNAQILGEITWEKTDEFPIQADGLDAFPRDSPLGQAWAVSNSQSLKRTIIFCHDSKQAHWYLVCSEYGSKAEKFIGYDSLHAHPQLMDMKNARLVTRYFNPKRTEEKPRGRVCIKFKHEYLGVQTDGSSCGFWAATVCLLLAFGVDVTSDLSAVKTLKTIGLTRIKLFWKDVATEFCTDTEGVRRATLEPLLAQFCPDLDNVFGENDCVAPRPPHLERKFPDRTSPARSPNPKPTLSVDATVASKPLDYTPNLNDPLKQREPRTPESGGQALTTALIQLRVKTEEIIQIDAVRSKSMALCLVEELKSAESELCVGSCILNARTIERVLPGNWLNDEIINAVVHVLENRDNKMLNCMVGTTWILPTIGKATGSGDVLQETKLFSLRDLLLPVNVDNVHWMTAHIVFVESTIHFYDSLKPAGNTQNHERYASRAKASEAMTYAGFALITVVQTIKGWLRDKAAKEKEPFNMRKWKYDLVETEPQTNNNDCGVHTIIFMICIALFGDIDAVPSKLLISTLKQRPDSIRLGLILPLLTRAASVDQPEV